MQVGRLVLSSALLGALVLAGSLAPPPRPAAAGEKVLYCGPIHARDGDRLILAVANNTDKDGEVELKIFRGDEGNNEEEDEFDLDDGPDAASLTAEADEDGSYFGKIIAPFKAVGTLSLVRDGEIKGTVPCASKSDSGTVACGPFLVPEDHKVRIMALGTSSGSGEVKLKIFEDNDEAASDTATLDGVEVEDLDETNEDDADEYWATAELMTPAAVTFQIENPDGNLTSIFLCRTKL